MANECESVSIKYQGNGTQKLFTFPFTYISYQDIVAFIYNENTKTWVNQENKFVFANATTLEFLTPPPAPTDSELDNVWITRNTDLEQMLVTFYPGSSIRAQDLNDDFDQLRLAVQEGKCALEEFKGALTDDFVNKTNFFTRPDQEAGKWEDDGDQEFVASTGAIAARHDVEIGDTLPRNPPYQQPGKEWKQTDPCYSSYWNQSANAWVAYVNTGPRGVPGQNGANADVQVGVTSTGEPGTDAIVIDSGSDNVAILNFTIPRGDKGERGSGLNVSGYIDVPGPPAVDGVNEGDFIIDSEGHGWFWETSVNPPEWVDTGSIQGPQGNPGPDGTPGADGNAATIAIDNTITGDAGTDANVINTGTNVNANLVFTIPRGDKGADGTLLPISSFPPLP
jgi:hypothetical protein